MVEVEELAQFAQLVDRAGRDEQAAVGHRRMVARTAACASNRLASPVSARSSSPFAATRSNGLPSAVPCHSTRRRGRPSRRDLGHQVALHAVGDQRRRQRHVAARDRRRPRPAVGLQDVAVDGDRPLAEPAEVHHAAERPPDQALDLVRPAADLAPDGFAIGPLGGGPRQHRVLGGHPAGALAAQVRRHPIDDGRCTQHLRVADPDAARALRPFLDAEREADRSQVDGPRPSARRWMAGCRWS